MAPMLFALKMVMMQVMELEEGREVERLETTGQIFSPRLPRRLPEVSPSRGCSEALYLPADGEVGGGDRDGPNVMEQLRLLREMVLAEKHQAGEERRLACEERARAAEVRRRQCLDTFRSARVEFCEGNLDEGGRERGREGGEIGDARIATHREEGETCGFE